MTTLTINLNPFVVTDDQFYKLCQANPELRLERRASGEVVIMSPTGGETGIRNFRLRGQLWHWQEQHQSGQAFDSSTGFKLPNGATRSPDVSWISQQCWDALPAKQKRGFVPLCPDFVVELRLPTDDIEDTRAKMQEYLNNGARLGWLIDPETRTVEIYEPGEAVEKLYNPERVAGDPVLPGFVLNLKRVWG